MPPLFIDPERIGACANPDSVVITANRRLAEQLKQAFSQPPADPTDPAGAAIEADRTPAPASIIALEDWLLARWQELVATDGPVALNTDQDLVLWERIIQQHSAHLLLKPHATARLAQAAYRTLCNWEQAISPAFYTHPDTSQFARWVTAYEAESTRHGWIDQASRTRKVCEGFADEHLAKTNNIILVGFQSLPPLLEKLLNLAAANLHTPARPDRSARTHSLACDNSSEEIIAAAQWSRAMLASGKQRIGIIIPELAQQRAEVERVFQAVHQPREANDFLAQAPTLFNISASPGLAKAPLIHAAIGLLRLNAREIDTRELLGLLRSPFVLSPHFGATSHLERGIRRIGMPVYTRDRLMLSLQQLNERAADHSPSPWLDGLNEFFELAPGDNNKTQSVTIRDWIDVFKNQLKALQWPGLRTLDSNEFQQLSRWHQALDELAELDAILGKLPVEAALAQLTRHLGAIEFQPQSDTAPIQVLGLLEGAGLEFDVLWLMGMNDNAWPAPARPNPFIPFFIQRESGMPHATPERELDISRALFDTCLQNADDIILSYALAKDDDALRPSRLIADHPAIPFVELDLPPMSPERADYLQAYAQNPVEELDDTKGPELQPDAEGSAGGAQLVKDQASCPFKGFARHRLRVRELDEPGYHLTTMERGTILHRALEVIWQQLLDSAELASISAQDLEQQLNSAAHTALRPHAARRPDLLAPHYLKLEQQRLVRLLWEWLLVEQTRAPFNIVATEKSVTLEIAELPLKLRIDRIDRMADGRLAIIDYKTGSCSLGQWHGDRPDEPQLPLYLLSTELGADIGALSFARVSVDGMGWIGISEQDGIAPGIRPPALTRNWGLATEWDDLRLHWQDVLGELVQAYKYGHAAVDPKNALSCRFCKLHSLCRIGERDHLARTQA